jgi:hypothetical protein
VSEDTSRILAVPDLARPVCVENTQVESIFLKQIFWTTNLSFCYGDLDFTTIFNKKAALLDRRKHCNGRTIHSRSFHRGDDCVTGFDLMTGFTTTTVDGIVAASGR